LLSELADGGMEDGGAAFFRVTASAETGFSGSGHGCFLN
jgi:hypothetical protein